MTLNHEETLDATNWRLLRELQENARLPLAELGRRVGLSQPATAERIRRMEEMGVISGYHTHINTEKVGFALTVFIRITSGGERCSQMSAYVRELPEVLECHRVTGNDSFILKVIVSSVGHLEWLVDRLAPYGQVTSSLVMSSPVVRRTIEGEPDAHAQKERH